MNKEEETWTEEIITEGQVEYKKKSELFAEHKVLTEQSEKLVSEMQKREYDINFGQRKIYERFVKFIEKDAGWSHSSATGLIMLYNNLREQRDKTKEDNWDGIITLRAAGISILWGMMTKMTGSGFFEARNFVELMASVGQELSNAMNQVQEDNQGLRDVHLELGKIDSILDSGAYEDDTDEKDSRYTLADEVDPQT